MRNKVKTFNFVILSVFALFKTGTLELNNGQYSVLFARIFYV